MITYRVLPMTFDVSDGGLHVYDRASGISAARIGPEYITAADWQGLVAKAVEAWRRHVAHSGYWDDILEDVAAGRFALAYIPEFESRQLESSGLFILRPVPTVAAEWSFHQVTPAEWAVVTA